MALSVELAEQYANTYLDLFRLGPREFVRSLRKTPSRYLRPVPFLAGSLAILSITITVTASYYADVPAHIREALPHWDAPVVCRRS